jgi:hypothetical protein
MENFNCYTNSSKILKNGQSIFYQSKHEESPQY